jgi:hypothetical protein
VIWQQDQLRLHHQIMQGLCLGLHHQMGKIKYSRTPLPQVSPPSAAKVFVWCHAWAAQLEARPAASQHH